MQVKMAATSGVCIGFLVLVMCLSHGSWSGSARPVIADEFMLSESKMQLTEEPGQAANEPIPPNGLLEPEQVEENNKQPLEVVHGSPSPTPTISTVDQIDCARPFWRVAAPGSRPWGWAPSGTPLPYPGCQPSYGPWPNPACQPACAPQSGYPNPACQPTCAPQSEYPNPACQPACAPQSGYPNPTCQPACAPQSGYPNPACQPACAPQSWYPNPACQPACAPSSGYPPQTNPRCEPSSSPYPSPECQPSYSPYPAPCSSSQPNPECLNPGCAPSHSQPGCLNPGCAPSQIEPGYGYPPQTNPGGYVPMEPAYPPQMEVSHPPLPEPFYPPQHQPSNPFGPRMTEENSINDGSPQSSEVEIEVADIVEEGGPKNEQESSDVITPGNA